MECLHCHGLVNVAAGKEMFDGVNAADRSMKVQSMEDNEAVIPTGYHELEPNGKITQGDLVLTFGSDEWKESRNLGQIVLPSSSQIYIRKSVVQ